MGYAYKYIGYQPACEQTVKVREITPILEKSGTRLKEKVAIVTGGGSRAGCADGTGLATAVLFAKQGAKVLVVDTDADNAGRTVAAIKDAGGETSAFIADVTRSADCKAMVETAIERFAHLDILFNNVGISGIGNPGTVLDVKEDGWERMMDVNLKSMMLTCKYALPAMLETGGGSIINISSIAALRSPNMTPEVAYAASKGAVISLTRNMAVHHGRDGIRVNCIVPGYLYASMVSNIADEYRELRRRTVPLGTEGTAWDVAWAAVFLASDESRWISGVALPVDAALLATTPLTMLKHLR